MNKKVIFLCILMFNYLVFDVLASGIESNTHTSPMTPSFTLSTKSTHKITDEQLFSFGYLQVPENRSKPNGKSVRLPVYIFKSRNPGKNKDPIIYTVGGPGASTMRSAQFMKYYQYLDDRDFILFEQRGTEYSQPNLGCPEWVEVNAQLRLNKFTGVKTQKVQDPLVKAVEQCRQKHTIEGVDLDSYNTTENAADINDLAVALKLEQYNLLTISYSTRLAQTLMRDYPERIRSVVMDSSLPLSQRWDEQSISNTIATLNKIFQDCESQEYCHKTYPELKDKFYGVLETFTKTPLSIQLTHPETKKPFTHDIYSNDIVTVFSGFTDKQLPYIPLQLASFVKGDYSDITDFYQKQLESSFDTLQQSKKGFSDSIGSGIGMRLSVWCSEETPNNDTVLTELEQTKFAFMKKTSPRIFEPAICSAWQVSTNKAFSTSPVHSDIPVLLLSGGYDLITPPKWTKDMKKRLVNSFHLVFSGWTHNVTTNWSNSCGMTVANEFFNNPHRRPTSQCFKDIQTPQFQ